MSQQGAASVTGVSVTGSMTSSKAAAQYEAWLTRALSVDLSDVDDLNLFLQSGHDNRGRPVLVFFGSRLPVNKISMQRVFMHFVRELDQIVTQEYTIVLLYTNVSAENQPEFAWLRWAYNVLPRKYKKNLKTVYVVHPTIGMKMLFAFFQAFISDKFWKKVVYIDSLLDLYKCIRRDQIILSNEVFQYDLERKGHYQVLISVREFKYLMSDVCKAMEEKDELEAEIRKRADKLPQLSDRIENIVSKCDSDDDEYMNRRMEELADLCEQTPDAKDLRGILSGDIVFLMKCLSQAKEAKESFIRLARNIDRGNTSSYAKDKQQPLSPRPGSDGDSSGGAKYSPEQSVQILNRAPSPSHKRAELELQEMHSDNELLVKRIRELESALAMCDDRRVTQLQNQLSQVQAEKEFLSEKVRDLEENGGSSSHHLKEGSLDCGEAIKMVDDSDAMEKQLKEAEDEKIGLEGSLRAQKSILNDALGYLATRLDRCVKFKDDALRKSEADDHLLKEVLSHLAEVEELEICLAEARGEEHVLSQELKVLADTLRDVKNNKKGQLAEVNSENELLQKKARKLEQQAHNGHAQRGHP